MSGPLGRRLEQLERREAPPRRIIVATRAQADAWGDTPPADLADAIIVITGINRDPGDQSHAQPA
jgi:hypothetical protein